MLDIGLLISPDGKLFNVEKMYQTTHTLTINSLRCNQITSEKVHYVIPTRFHMFIK